MKDLDVLQNAIGYHFNDIEKLKIALTHSSFANEMQVNKRPDNERYEFLGDAVLELLISDYLFNNYEKYPEGKLTKKRASIVCEQTLFLCSKKIDLGSFLYLGKGEELTGGRRRPSVVSDAMEALIGALYLDGGLDAVHSFINKFIIANLKEIELFNDSKTALQELNQSGYDEKLSYILVSEEGPDHDKHFVTQALLGEKIIGVGEGHTKKASEQEAAYQALLKLR